MNAAGFLTALYPPAVRERWGADLADEVAASGVRSWPDTVAGAARLWLHPADWPETSAGQTRHVVTVTAFALAAVTGLLLRTVQPTPTLTADLRHPVTSLWWAPLLLGVALAMPLPPLRGDTLRRLAGQTVVRTLAAPAAALSAVCFLAWSGATAHLTGVADTAAVGCYWLTLGFVALRGCVFVTRAARVVPPPGTRRLSTALLCLGAGLTGATVQSLPSLTGAAHPEVLAQAVGLGLLATTALGLGNDLRGVPG